MEQYIHTLIPVDSQFRPRSSQVADFFHRLVSEFMFSPVSGQRHGLIAMKPSGKLRWGTNAMTGEKISIPAQDRLDLTQFEEIPAAIEGCSHYTVAQSGQWVGEDRPISLFRTDGIPFDGNYLCTVVCEHRSQLVSTSAWDVEAGPSPRDIPVFGSTCNSPVGSGVFPNPWTGEPIELAHAGCARFWIEFEFGKFIYPKVDGSFDVLKPALVQNIEECFGTSFAQACRFW